MLIGIDYILYEVGAFSIKWLLSIMLYNVGYLALFEFREKNLEFCIESICEVHILVVVVDSDHLR